MARRSIGVADVREILVHWDAGEGVSQIARSLGYARPTIRKYIRAAERVGLQRGSRRQSEADWERLARQALEQVGTLRPVGEVTAEVAKFHEYLATRVGQVRLTVLHQRLRDEQQLSVSWGTFYRYVRAHWPERIGQSPRTTVRLEDPPPGSEAQVDFFFAGYWDDPQAQRRRKLYGFLMIMRNHVSTPDLWLEFAGARAMVRSGMSVRDES